MSKAWKDAERQVARLLGGTRRVRVDYSESCEDVHHQKYAIEVKYGKQIPKWVGQIKAPVLVNGLLLLFPLGSSMSFESAESIYRKRIDFLIEGMCQAHKYNKTKRPMLCMKPPRYRGVVACMYVMDYLDSEFLVPWSGSRATKTEGISEVSYQSK